MPETSNRQYKKSGSVFFLVDRLERRDAVVAGVCGGVSAAGGALVMTFPVAESLTSTSGLEAVLDGALRLDCGRVRGRDPGVRGALMFDFGRAPGVRGEALLALRFDFSKVRFRAVGVPGLRGSGRRRFPDGSTPYLSLSFSQRFDSVRESKYGWRIPFTFGTKPSL